MLGLLIVLATVVSVYLAARSHLRYRARNNLIYEQRFGRSDRQNTASRNHSQA